MKKRMLGKPKLIPHYHWVPSEETGSFVLMHLLYIVTKLHRYCHPRFLTTERRRQHSIAAHEHADRLLDVACILAKDGSTMVPLPFASYAVLEALDVLEARARYRHCCGSSTGSPPPAASSRCWSRSGTTPRPTRPPCTAGSARAATRLMRRLRRSRACGSL